MYQNFSNPSQGSPSTPHLRFRSKLPTSEFRDVDPINPVVHVGVGIGSPSHSNNFERKALETSRQDTPDCTLDSAGVIEAKSFSMGERSTPSA